MKVKVIRENKSTYHARIASLGTDAELVDIPSTIDGVKFGGVYTDKTRKQAAVAWPADAPFERQENLARHIAAHIDSSLQSAAWPVEEFEVGLDRKGLSYIPGGEH